MPKYMPTIAKAVTVYTLTDGTLRVVEYADTPDFCPDRPIFCETPEDALDYLNATDALSINPSWYEGGAKVD